MSDETNLCSSCPLGRQFRQLEERMTNMEHLMIGVHGQEGLAQEMRTFMEKTRAEMEELKKQITKWSGALMLFTGLTPLWIWLINTFIK